MFRSVIAIELGASQHFSSHPIWLTILIQLEIFFLICDENPDACNRFQFHVITSASEKFLLEVVPLCVIARCKSVDLCTVLAYEFHRLWKWCWVINNDLSVAVEGYVFSCHSTRCCQQIGVSFEVTFMNGLRDGCQEKFSDTDGIMLLGFCYDPVRTWWGRTFTSSQLIQSNQLSTVLLTLQAMTTMTVKILFRLVRIVSKLHHHSTCFPFRWNEQQQNAKLARQVQYCDLKRIAVCVTEKWSWKKKYFFVCLQVWRNIFTEIIAIH